MRIIFMGSPEFSLPTLASLIALKHNIVAVYTKPDSFSGRGMKLSNTPVDKLAQENKLKVFKPKSLKDSKEHDIFLNLKPDLVVVAAYGQIIPKNFLDIPPYGFINIHPSDLPRWRGAAPIERTLMAGDEKTAVCIIKLEQTLDTGDIILKEDIKLTEKTTFKDLHDLTSVIGSRLIIKTIDDIKTDRLRFTAQDEKDISYAEKIKPSERLIDFNKTSKEIYNLIRGLSPKPCAYFKLNNEVIKIIHANYQTTKHYFNPGTVIDNDLTIACGNGIIIPKLLQKQGKKMLCTKDFLLGCSIDVGKNLNS